MTMISNLVFSISKKKNLRSDQIRVKDISIVIPVKDNQSGIDCLLESIFQSQRIEQYPNEVIIVDNNSKIPIVIRSEFLGNGLKIDVIKCKRKGPASARNEGAINSKGKWLLFIDSDCLFTENTILGYIPLNKEAVAYSGLVKAAGTGFLSKYYDDQEILVPLKVKKVNEEYSPQYLITANCLIWKEAFTEIRGFNESIVIAGGEDVDLGLRLSEIGNLEYAYGSIVNHNFSDGFTGFLKRFIRYGKGNRIIEEMYESDLSPKLFSPNKKNLINGLLAKLQWLGLSIGYNLMDKKIRKTKYKFSKQSSF